MVGSVTIVVPVDSSTCHRALKVDRDYADDHDHDHDDQDGCADDDADEDEDDGSDKDDLDRSLSENVVNLAETRERCSILASSVCLMGRCYAPQLELMMMVKSSFRRLMMIVMYHSKSVNEHHRRVF